MREQNALPCELWITITLTAKYAIDNGVAGRAAKGANPFVVCGRRDSFMNAQITVGSREKRETIRLGRVRWLASAEALA